MIDIDIILGNRCTWREGIICMPTALVLVAPKSVLANRGFVHGINAWSVQLQLDDGGENM
jgi:hypothetical protein